ncbi:MAG: hypothetical protein ABJB02_08120 [Dokdonella sp.]
MIRHSPCSNALLSAATLCSLSLIAFPAMAANRGAAAKVKSESAERHAVQSGEIVAYESLEQQVGAEIAIETTLSTIRRGTLVKFTNPTLTLRLGPEHGSINLSMPRETIRSIRLLVPAPIKQPKTGAPLKPETPRAEKN